MKHAIKAVSTLMIVMFTLLFSLMTVVEGANSYSYNGHTYTVYNTSLTWQDAQNYCESLGGHLVTITSAQEQKFIESIIRKGTKNHYYLGATNFSGTWRWVTGEPFIYKNWNPGEPSGGSGGYVENYLQIFRVKNPLNANVVPYKWNDTRIKNNGTGMAAFSNYSNSGFICEFEPKTNNTTRVTTTVPTGSIYMFDHYKHYKEDVYDYIINNNIRSVKKNDGVFTQGFRMTVNNVVYSKGMAVRGWGSLYFGLGSKYSSLTGKVGFDDSCDYSSGSVEIYADGYLVKRIDFREGEQPKSFSADIIRCSELRIYVKSSGYVNLIDFVLQ